MPDTDPNNAPRDLAPDTGDTAAKQVRNTGEDTSGGGGGLGGEAAADALAGSARAPDGASPNSPIDVGVSAPDGDDRNATRDAQKRSIADGPGEPDRTSR